MVGTCPLCGGETGGIANDYREGWCRICRGVYNDFTDDLPPEWEKITGSTGPTFEEWQEERLIKKALDDGKIDATEAKRRADTLKKRLEMKYLTTPEALAAWRQSLESSQTTTVFNSPSLFGDN